MKSLLISLSLALLFIGTGAVAKVGAQAWVAVKLAPVVAALPR